MENGKLITVSVSCSPRDPCSWFKIALQDPFGKPGEVAPFGWVPKSQATSYAQTNPLVPGFASSSLA